MKKKLIVGFSRSKLKFPIGSWLIRLYQLTPYSHIYIRIPTDKFPSDIIIHASEGKVQRMSETQFNKRHEVIKEFTLYVDDATYIQCINEMHEISGDDYNLLQNLGLFIVDIMSFLGKTISNPWKTGWNCSEFVYYILSKIYPNKFYLKDANTVTPKQINRILKTLEFNNYR